MADELTCRFRKRLPSGFELQCDLRIPLGESPVTVLFGPSGSGLHGACESVDIESLHTCATVLAESIVAFCGA